MFNSLTSVHEEPFHDSVLSSVEVGAPPKLNAAVCVPAPLFWYLAVFNSLTSDQLEPFQDSVTSPPEEIGGAMPPKINPAG